MLVVVHISEQNLNLMITESNRKMKVKMVWGFSTFVPTTLWFLPAVLLEPKVPLGFALSRGCAFSPNNVPLI